MRPFVGRMQRPAAQRKLGWTMIGLAPISLLAAAGVVVFSGLLTASPAQVLIARTLASVAAVLFSSGWGLVLWARRQRREHMAILALRVLALVCANLAALITSWQLLFVNDTVAPVVRVALWTLVATWLAATSSVLLASGTTFRRRVRPPRPR